jgi:hypothetical protein
MTKPLPVPTASAFAVPGPNEYVYVRIGISASKMFQPCAVAFIATPQSMRVDKNSCQAGVEGPLCFYAVHNRILAARIDRGFFIVLIVFIRL